MSHRLRRRILFLASALLLTSGTLALAQVTEEQESGSVKCWLESCEGRVCIKIEIKCPDKIEPVPPVTSA
jgi:hypothetical protein